ncbi:MAG: VapB-type antitoxin [Nitrososphaerota archaeon]|nr:VapB-type antitoxin [Nitrososphaerota archaeon]MDG6978154.1 VapB-type antitoxin [Nitrososphaerota archaeon]
MSSVYSVRLPKELKKALEQLDDIDWQGETRAFLERKVREELRRKELADAKRLRDRMARALSSADLIREDRDHVH